MFFVQHKGILEAKKLQKTFQILHKKGAITHYEFYPQWKWDKDLQVSSGNKLDSIVSYMTT